MSAQLEPKRQEFHGGCPHDCPDTCSMVFEVEDGKLVGVRGNKEHPMTRGGLCVKLKDYEKRHYHPDRVLYPLRRTGPKGSKQFERITWDEALDEITDRWKAIMPNSGEIRRIRAGFRFFAHARSSSARRPCPSAARGGRA